MILRVTHLILYKVKVERGKNNKKALRRKVLKQKAQTQKHKKIRGHNLKVLRFP